MFKAVVFAQDQESSNEIEQAAVESGQVSMLRVRHAFPSPYELSQTLNSFDPDIAFIEIRNLVEAEQLHKQIQILDHGAAIVWFVQEANEPQVPRGMQEDGLPILFPPITNARLLKTVEQAMCQARPLVQENLIAFLPAKAGSGSTTVALNIAGSLAHDAEQKVLALEADLRSGPFSVLLKPGAGYSVLEALENVRVLDDALWERIVAPACGIDLLASPRLTEPAPVSWARYHALLQFLEPRYDTIVVDLPEAVNDATVEIVRRARSIYIVTTPELPALALASQRRQELVKRGIPAGRIAAILNRWTPDEVPVEDFEGLLEGPVAAVFPSDYLALRRAEQQGRLIGRKSALGRSFSDFAAKLAAAAPKRSRKPSAALLSTLASKQVHALQ